MIVSLKSLIGRRLRCNDGYLCKVYDIHLHSSSWLIQQIALNAPARPWRKVVVGPDLLSESDWAKRYISIASSREEIEHASRIDDNPPMDWLAARDEVNFCVCATHWSPLSEMPEGLDRRCSGQETDLYSLRHLLHYTVQAKDGSVIGKVIDLSMDDTNWQVASVAVCVRDEGKSNFIELEVGKVASVDFERRVISLTITKEKISTAQAYDFSASSKNAKALASELGVRFQDEYPADEQGLPRRTGTDSGWATYSLKRMVARETFPVCFVMQKKTDTASVDLQSAGNGMRISCGLM